MADSGSQLRVNKEAWERGGHVAGYANRRLLPVEVLLLVRYREALSGRVLEVGCGAGRILGYLVQLGGEVHGTDISRDMVEHCHAAYPAAHVRLGDVADVRAGIEGKFSALLAMDNLIDVFDDSERRRVLGEMRDLLEPDGLLIFGSHNLGYIERDRSGSLSQGKRVQELLWKAGSRPIEDVVRVARRMPQRLANRRRLGPLESRGADHAIINDEAHDYSLLHYYIRHGDQRRQLQELGYELLECLDVDGRTLADGEDSPAPWLHYVARPVSER
jgi:SAM-dependent methyltransferase